MTWITLALAVGLLLDRVIPPTADWLARSEPKGEDRRGS